LKFQAREEVANRILLEASLNRGFPSKSENIRLSEPYASNLKEHHENESNL
jgi:hypothetical protein